MVAIKSYEADKFLSARANHIWLYVVMGKDPGLISERVRKVSKLWAAEPADIIHFDGDSIAEDPLALLDEANSISLFGGSRAIILSPGRRNYMPAIEQLVAAPPRDCAIIIEAGDLKKDHALRKLSERLKEAVCIECYPDSARDLETLISAQAKEAGLSIDRDVMAALIPLLGGDRLTTRSELEKLLLYTKGQGRITREDVNLMVADESDLAMDDAVNGAFDGNFSVVEDTAARYFSSGGDGSVLLGAALRHALVLHRMCLDAANGANPDDLPRKYGRWGGAKTLVPQIKRWNSARMLRAVTLLAEGVRNCRRDQRLSDVIAVRTLWSVALAAGRR
jgi:DNA polymerase-3 subunit delta